MKSEAQTSAISGQLEVQQRAARTQATIPTRPVRPSVSREYSYTDIFMQTRPSIKITILNHHPHHCTARAPSDEWWDEWLCGVSAVGLETNIRKLILINNKSGSTQKFIPTHLIWFSHLWYSFDIFCITQHKNNLFLNKICIWKIFNTSLVKKIFC